MMTSLFSISQSAWTNFAAALLHSVWQGVVIAFLLYLFLRYKPADKTEQRYRVSLGMLFVVLMSFMVTWMVLSTAGKITRTNSSMQIAGSAPSMDPRKLGDKSIQDKSSILKMTQALDSFIPSVAEPVSWTTWFLGVWWIGCIVMTIRMIRALTAQQRLYRCSQPLADERIMQFLETLIRKTGLSRKIRVLTHEGIDSPVVFGILRPTLVLPLSLVTGAPMPFIEAILAHELAHIQRHDYLVNLLQMGMETIFFFNPAIWWINRQIRLERETCCDLSAIRYTGERITYVNALAFVLDQQRSLNVSSVAAPAFIQRGKSFFTMERFKRIAQPWHYPVPQVSKKSVCVLLVIGILLIFFVSRMTDSLAEEAKKWFVTGEQINRMVEAGKKYGSDVNIGEKGQITIAGKVRNWDYSPVAPALSLVWVDWNWKNTEIIPIQLSPELTFSSTVKEGNVYIIAEHSGYIASVTGSFIKSVRDINLVLQKEYPAKLKIVDGTGKPVPGARMKWSYRSPIIQLFKPAESISGQNGIITIDHYNGDLIVAKIMAEGYQRIQQEITLKSNEIYEIKLQPSKITKGIVVSRKTGKPVVNAKLKMVYEDWFLPGTLNIDKPEYETASNQNGEFALTQLKDKTEYAFLIEADGLESKIVQDISAGENDIKVDLGPELYIKGQITGNLSLLGEKPEIQYNNPIQAGFESCSYYQKAPVRIQDNTGYFEIKKLWEGTVDILLPYKKFRLFAETPIDDVEISLNDILPATRTVQFQFKIPPKSTSPSGFVTVQYQKHYNPADIPETMHLPIKNGLAQMEIMAPAKISLFPDALIGGYFTIQKNIDIPVSPDPFVYTIPTYSAGSVFGTLSSSIEPVTQPFEIRVITQKKSPYDNSPSLERTKVFVAWNNGFSISPLPLGGTYSLLFIKNHYFYQTQSFKLTSENPVSQLNLHFSAGKTITGQITSENSLPQPCQGVSLGYHIKRIKTLESFVSKVFMITSNNFMYDTDQYQRIERLVKVDEGGHFTIDEVNPDVAGSYVLFVYPQKDYQPCTYEIKDMNKPVSVVLKKGHLLEGTVIDTKTSWPVPDAGVVVCSNSYNWELNAITDAKGKFFFNQMGDETFRLYVSSGRYLIFPRGDNNLSANSPQPVTVAIDIPAWSELKPVQPENK